MSSAEARNQRNLRRASRTAKEAKNRSWKGASAYVVFVKNWANRNSRAFSQSVGNRIYASTVYVAC